MLFARGLAVFVRVLPYVWHSLSHSKSHSCVIILYLVLPFLLIGSAITVHDGYRCSVSCRSRLFFSMSTVAVTIRTIKANVV